jgi:hypothetical protein
MVWSLIASVASVAGAGVQIYSGVKSVQLAKQANKEVRRANAASEEISRMNATKRRLSESKQKIQQVRAARIARGKTASIGEQTGKSGAGSSFAGFGGSIVSTASSNLGYLNQISGLDESIFNKGTEYNIFANKANQLKGQIDTLGSISKVASAFPGVVKEGGNLYKTISKGKWF